MSPYSLGYAGDLPCLLPTGGQVAVPMGSNNSIFILFRATDNSGLASLHVTVTPASQTGFELNWTPLSGKSQCARHRLEDYPAGAYNVTFPLNPPASSYTFAIVATDRAGHVASASFVVLPS